MTHVRQAIRDNVTSALKTGVTLVSNRVYPARVYSLRADQLPAILVYTKTEDVEMISMGRPSTLDRNVRMSIDIYVSETSDADNAIDNIMAQVESSIGNDVTLSGVARDAMLTDVEIEHFGEGEMPVFVARMSFDVQYLTAQNDGETAL